MNFIRHEESHHPHRLAHVFEWLGLVALVCSLSGTAGAQPERFNAVKAWRGTFIAKAHQSTSENLAAGGQNLGSVSVSYDSYFTADFLLDEFEDDPAVWRGRILNPALDAGYRAAKKLLIDPREGNTLLQEESFNTSGTPDFGGQPVVELKFHRERGWSFNMSTPRRDAELTEKVTIAPKKGPVIRQEEKRKISASADSVTATRPYPARGMILFAGSEKSEGSRDIPGSIAGGIVWEYTVYLEPAAMEELRLEIEEPTDYATWRPETTPDRGRGKPLEVTARVTTASGGKPQSRVEQFIWDLQDTSTEAGVAMNYPQKVDTFELDMELDAAGPFFALSQNNQRMERAVREGYADTVKVVPFDWGGWSTLQVTAVMADGRRVTGKLKGKSEYGLRVPKRDPNSHIADGWKAQRKSGADNLDDEREPVGDGHPGDGYTLYEEYRGFVIEGEHVEGDPAAKDFFVLNGIGADAETGIGLFESLSGFRVHTTTRAEEMDPATRLMNGNNSGDAHVVDQHGVWIAPASSASQLAGRQVDSYGASTVATDDQYKKFGFRPGITQGIGILPRGHAESDFTKPFNLGAQDAAVSFDRAIAHELMHSVGVIEHGTGDGQIEFVFVGPTDGANGLGRPYFAVSGNKSKPVELRNEAGHDLAAAVYVRHAPALAATMNQFRAPFVGNPTDPGYPRMSETELQRYCEGYLVDAFALKGLVGATGGPHSGDQDCIMRYHFASFYPMTQGSGGYYQIAAGAERLGFGLCRSPAGTGVNAPAFKPQSRHGNATAEAGNCAAQICPNDLVPPRPAPF